MPGREYQIIMAPSAHRLYKKFSPALQERVKEEAKRLAENPHQYEELEGPLRGIRSYHFHFENTQYRIAYRVREDAFRIEIVLVKSRQNFYEILRRILK